jgi:hypothetical protein
MSVFCNAWFCVCLVVLICGCVYVCFFNEWLFVSLFFNVWLCVCLVF